MSSPLLITGAFCLISLMAAGAEPSETPMTDTANAPACPPSTIATTEMPATVQHCMQRFRHHMQGKVAACKPAANLPLPNSQGETP